MFIWNSQFCLIYISSAVFQTSMFTWKVQSNVNTSQINALKQKMDIDPSSPNWIPLTETQLQAALTVQFHFLAWTGIRSWIQLTPIYHHITHTAHCHLNACYTRGLECELGKQGTGECQWFFPHLETGLFFFIKYVHKRRFLFWGSGRGRTGCRLQSILSTFLEVLFCLLRWNGHISVQFQI